MSRNGEIGILDSSGRERERHPVVYGAQTSYDPRVIQKLFNTKQVHPALITFFGMTSAEDVSKAKFHPLFEESSPITHATADDPPVMLFYPQANKPLPPNSSGQAHIHHPKFGALLKTKLDKLGESLAIETYERKKPQPVPVIDPSPLGKDTNKGEGIWYR